MYSQIIFLRRIIHIELFLSRIVSSLWSFILSPSFLKHYPQFSHSYWILPFWNTILCLIIHIKFFLLRNPPFSHWYQILFFWNTILSVYTFQCPLPFVRNNIISFIHFFDTFKSNWSLHHVFLFQINPSTSYSWYHINSNISPQNITLAQ